MAGSIRLHLELKAEDADKIYAATQNGQLAAFGISEARLLFRDCCLTWRRTALSLSFS
jgi:hypothetical protein